MCHVDSDGVRPADRFGSERLGEHRAEPVRVKPVCVFLGLPDADDPELAVAVGSDVARLETGGFLLSNKVRLEIEAELAKK